MTGAAAMIATAATHCIVLLSDIAAFPAHIDLIRAANPAPTIKPNAKTRAAMTIRSGHHVAGSPRAGRGDGKIGHVSIKWLLFHMA